MIERLCHLASSLGAEFRLIARVWTNQYPENPKWRLSWIERAAMCAFVCVRIASLSQVKGLAKTKEKRSQISEFYALARLLILVGLLAFPSQSLMYAGVIVYLLIDGFNFQLCIIFVDRYAVKWSLRSMNRSLMLLVVNYFELVIGFAGLYLWAGTIESTYSTISTVGDSLYFSVVTITTLGYGDFSPTDSVGKFLVSTEAIMGILFLVLVLGTFVAGIPRLGREKSE